MASEDTESLTFIAKAPKEEAPVMDFRKLAIDEFLEDDDEESLQWEREGFASEDDWREYWATLVDDNLNQSKTKFSPYKRTWKIIDDRIELLTRLSIGLNKSASNADLVLLPQAIEKAISIQLEGRPRPYFEPLQETDEQFVSGLNFYQQMALDEQGFDLKLAASLYHAKKFGVGCIKSTIVDAPASGKLFGQDGKIELEKVDMRYVWPDPFASSWSNWKWLIVATPMDLDEAKRRYPRYAEKIKADGSSTGETDDEKNERIASMSPSGREFKPGRRDRVIIKEMWIKDMSEKYVFIKDQDGNIVYGEDGEPRGKWEPAYPGMRLVICAGKEMVFNGPNPYRHGHAPYVFLTDRVSDQLFPVADCEILVPLEDKINNQHKIGYRHTAANVNSPWVCGSDAFDSPDKVDQLTSEEGGVIIKNQGSEVTRLPAGELPQSFFGFMSWLQSIFNDLTGVSDINQGMLQKGAQLSADAIGQLQGASAANIKMKQNLLEQALKELGYQMQWNIRQVCDRKASIQLNDPSSGEKLDINWNGDDEQDDYTVNVQVTTSLPANKAGIMSTALQLYKEHVIDRQACLDMIKLANRGEINKRMTDRETQLAALGEMAKLKGNRSGAPGRRSAS